jgi:hypothetical protein
MYHYLFDSTYFPLVQCCRASVQSDLLIHSRKAASKVLTLISSSIFQTRERSSSADTNCCPWRWFFRCPKKKTRKSQRKPNPASPVDRVDVAQFARTCYLTTLLSFLLDIALHCPHARPTSFHLSPHSTLRDDLG